MLDDFAGDDPHGLRRGQHVKQPHVGLFKEELHRIAVHHLHPVHGLQHIAERIRLFGQEAVEGEFDILGHQLAPVDGRLVLPVHPVAEMEDIGRVVRCFPAFGQIGLDEPGVRRHPCPDPIPHELTVDKAQCGMGLDTGCEMRVKVRHIPASDTENPAALRWPCFVSSECGGVMQRPGRQRNASGDARGEQLTTIHPSGILRTCLRCVHRSPSYMSSPGQVAQPHALHRIR